MKMILHQTPGDGIRYRVNMLMIFLQEEAIILFFAKQIIITIGVVVDVVISIELQHLFIFYFIKIKIFQSVKLWKDW